MNNKKYETLSIPELNEKKAVLMSSASILTGLLILLFVLMIWSTIRKGEFDWLSMLFVISCAITVFNNFKEAKKITNELKSRE